MIDARVDSKAPVDDVIDEHFQAPPKRPPSKVRVGTPSEGDILPGQSKFRALDEILSPISKVIIFVTIVLGAYQYFQSQQDARIERTMALIGAWNEEGLRETYDALNNVIWPLYAPAAEQIEALVKSGADRGALLANIGNRVTDPAENLAPDAGRNVERLFDYFERAAVCSDARLCDYDVFNTFLGNEARTFWLYFSSYAARKNATGYTGYGEWTERLARGEIARRPLFGLL